MPRLPKVELNWLDRTIGFFSPQAVLERTRARTIMALTTGPGGYQGGRRDRRQTSEWQTSFGSADADLLPDLEKLRERSRDLIRNVPLARGAVNTVTTSVVGTGLRLQSRVDRQYLGLSDDAADAWERNAERVFCEWADSSSRSCDIRRIQDFSGLQDLVLRTALIGGDVFIAKRFKERPDANLGLCLQIIEGDRVSSPTNHIDGASVDGGNRTYAGVEVDTDGAPVRYWVLNRHPGDTFGGFERKWTGVPAFADNGRRMILHLFRVLRPEQNRGEPYLSPVIESLKLIDKYRDSELMAAVISSMFTVFVKTEDQEGFNTSEIQKETGGRTGDTDLKLGAGLINDLLPGQTVEFADPGRPNLAFDPFTQAILRQIGVALELPFEILIKHFTASYSAARAALLEAWKFFRARREWLARDFCQPIYEEVISEAIERGILSAPGFFTDPITRQSYLGAEWIGPPPGQLDPDKEITAAQKRVDGGFSTLDTETKELTGRDWDTNHQQLVKERRMREADGLVLPVETLPAAPAPEGESDEKPDQMETE